MSDSTVGGEVNAIRAVAVCWATAIEKADLAALASLMAEDIVVVHGDGRSVVGRDAVLADLASSLEKVRVMQQIQPEETIVAGSWAFDRARVQTTVVSHSSDDTPAFTSQTWTLLQKSASRGWCVARVIGVVERMSQGE